LLSLEQPSLFSHWYTDLITIVWIAHFAWLELLAFITLVSTLL
jgi:hypothetical protein